MTSGIYPMDTEQNNTKYLRNEIIVYTSFATNKAKHILNGRISCSCNDHSYSIEKTCK